MQQSKDCQYQDCISALQSLQIDTKDTSFPGHFQQKKSEKASMYICLFTINVDGTFIRTKCKNALTTFKSEIREYQTG